MKRILGSIFILFFVFNCTKEKRSDYVINGTAEGVYNGMRVFISEPNPQSRQVIIDTAMVMNEKFTFNGKVDYPKVYYITINGTPGRFEVMLENSEMDLNLDHKILSNSVLSGSKSNTIFKTYLADTKKLKEDLIKASDALSESQFLRKTDLIKKDSAVLSLIKNKMTNYPYEYIKENSSSYAVLPILYSQLLNENTDFERLEDLYFGIDDTLKNTNEGKKIGQSITLIKQKLIAEKATAIGAKAPEFSAPNPDGEIIALNDVVKKGKITIIDFWAAWCGPCRRENPNIVNIYNKYHDKGLEIIGVGLDGRRGQRNPKEAWVKAIENDKLAWHQVSNLTYFDDIAKSYNVNSIPSMFILNDKGEIIAKNLRGKALEFKIAELLN